MKILVVCQYYYPEPFRIPDLCEELVRRGHQVTVLTGVPNYPEGRIYPGYGSGKRKHEKTGGVTIDRCFTVPRRSGILFRFLNYYSFALSSSLRVLSGRIKPENGEKFDVVFVNQLSPVMMAQAGIWYKKKYGSRLLLYCLDLWPESLIAGHIKRNSLIYRYYRRVSEKIYKSCDRICVSSRSFQEYLNENFGIPEERMAWLPQYAEELFTQIPEAEPKDTMDFVFAGNIGEVQSVGTVIEAARLLETEQFLRFHIVGGGTALEDLKKQAEGLSNVIFYGRRPLEEMPRFYTLADAMLVTLAPDPMLGMTLPGKVQSYLAAGKPVIGAADGEIMHVIREAGCGLCGSAGDAGQLAGNIRKFCSDPDRKRYAANSGRFYVSRFQKDTFMKNLEKEFANTCRSEKRNTAE